MAYRAWVCMGNQRVNGFFNNIRCFASLYVFFSEGLSCYLGCFGLQWLGLYEKSTRQRVIDDLVLNSLSSSCFTVFYGFIVLSGLLGLTVNGFVY